MTTTTPTRYGDEMPECPICVLTDGKHTVNCPWPEVKILIKYAEPFAEMPTDARLDRPGRKLWLAIDSLRRRLNLK